MKKIICLFLAILLCVVFVACSDKDNMAEGNREIKTLTQVEHVAEETLLYGFDSRAELEQIDASTGFGIARLNTDKEYIKHGDGSMYVRVDEIRYNQMPYVPVIQNYAFPYIKLYTSNFLNIKDFSHYSGLAIDLYNDSDRDISISFLIYTNTGYPQGYASRAMVMLDKQPAKKGAWNRLEFNFDPVKMAYRGINSVNQVLIVFEAKDINQDSAELYIDKISLLNSSNQIKKVAAPDYNGEKICDYENTWFANSATTYNIGSWYDSDYLFQPSFSHNTNPAFIKSGNGSLKITRKADAFNYLRYMNLRNEGSFFAIDYLNKINFASKNTTENSIYMDVYNDYEFPIDFGLIISDAVATSEKIYVLEPNSWNTIEFPMNTLTSAETVLNFSNITRFNVLFYEFFGSRDINIYVDDIRFDVKS